MRYLGSTSVLGIVALALATAPIAGASAGRSGHGSSTPSADVRSPAPALEVGDAGTTETGPCSPAPPLIYCTAKPFLNGCVASINAVGAPSFLNPTAFMVTASQLATNRPETAFISVNGANVLPFQAGFLCMNPPVFRSMGKSSGGTTGCTGSISYTLLDFLSTPAGFVLGPCMFMWVQYWVRDPGAIGSSITSNALEVLIVR